MALEMQRKEWSVSKSPRVKFGNWITTDKTRIGPFTLYGWGVLVGGILLAVLFLAVTLWQASLLILVLTVLYLLLFSVPFGDMDAGRTIAERWFESLRGTKRNMAGEAQYVTGIFSGLPADSLTALPGALLDVDEIEGIDGEGQPYVLLHHKSVGAIAATYMCAPDGTALQPQETIDSQVSQFGGWIASLSKDSAVIGGVIVVDSALSSSAPLVDKLRSEMAPHAPEVSRRAMMEAAELLPGKTSSAEAYATVVWGRGRLGDTVEDAAAEIAAKLPFHRSSLYAAGGGVAEVADSQDLARVVRTAYNPHRSLEFGTDDLVGREFRTRLTEAGPEYFDDSQRRVSLHDGVASMTVMMTVPPRMHITEDTFRELFSPQDKFLRKRVAVFYRPMNAGDAVRKAQQLRRGAGVAASAKGMASNFDKHKQKLADKTETELVEGAAMARFSLEVTVTFEPTQRAYREATQKLKTLLEGTNLAYRFVEVHGSAAFHSTLPLGVLPWLYQSAFASAVKGK